MTFTPAIKELLSLHEIFRRLGFPAEDLYIKPTTCIHGPPCRGTHIQFVLQHGHDGSPLFSIDVWENCTDVVRDWPAAVEWWNTPANLAGVAQIYQASKALDHAGHLLLALERKGLTRSGRAV